MTAKVIPLPILPRPPEAPQDGEEGEIRFFVRCAFCAERGYPAAHPPDVHTTATSARRWVFLLESWGQPKKARRFEMMGLLLDAQDGRKPQGPRSCR